MVNKISSCQRSNFLEQMYLIHDWLQIKEKRETVKHNIIDRYFNSNLPIHVKKQLNLTSILNDLNT